MGKKYVIHEQNIHFEVGYQIETPSDGEDVFVTPPKDGEIYVSEGNIYLGRDQRWYRISIDEIAKIVSQIEQKKIKLVCDGYCVALFSVAAHPQRGEFWQ